MFFPDPDSCTDPNGLIAVGGDLKPDTLLIAYRNGIFPWPISGQPLTWFSPPKRAVLDFKDLHVSRSLLAARKKSCFTFSLDQNFAQVIHACRGVRRPGQAGTWITPAMEKAYLRLHKLGHAHSVEAWNLKGKLVGGIYGVLIDGVFAGESMYFLEPNASKLALLYLIDYLKVRGSSWIDIQMLTPHMVNLGAKEIPRHEFLKRLKSARGKTHSLAME